MFSIIIAWMGFIGSSVWLSLCFFSVLYYRKAIQVGLYKVDWIWVLVMLAIFVTTGVYLFG